MKIKYLKYLWLFFSFLESKPSYTELISKLSLLLSGAIDYSQFEDEARSLFGIHAFVSFTMDKLVLNIVRQVRVSFVLVVYHYEKSFFFLNFRNACLFIFKYILLFFISLSF